MEMADAGVEVALAQLPGTALVQEYEGPFTIAYALQVRNPLEEEIEVVSVDLEALGASPYRLQSAQIPVSLKVRPGATEVVEFSMPAYSRGGEFSARAPVTIRGVVRFDSPSGKFRKVFTQRVSQPAAQGSL